MIAPVRKVYGINPRVYIILRGGLGNQLHQIAAGVRYAEERGGRAKIFAHIVDTSLNPERRGFFRKIPLKELFSGANLSEVNLLEKLLLKVILRYFPRFLAKRQVTELNFKSGFSSKVVFLRGWFQSHSYLPKNFHPEVLVNRKANMSNKIVIHVRLTDFLSVDEFPLDRQYYANAIDEMSREMSVRNFLCFSDDLQQVGQFIPSGLTVDFPEGETKLDPVELLYSLSSGSGLICSRSSLCWWAAQIVSSRGGTVFSPWTGEVHRQEWLSLDSSKYPKDSGV